MEIVVEELLASWDRQVRILKSVSELIDEQTRRLRPAPDSWPLDLHLCHIHECRYGWLNKVSPAHAEALGEVLENKDGEWVPIQDLTRIKQELQKSGKAVGEAVRAALDSGATQVGPYSHPIHFLQHMVWHEGWHTGLIFLALRSAGKEPSEDWEEENVWGVWRS